MTGSLNTNKEVKDHAGEVQLARVTSKKIIKKKQCTSRQLPDITDHKSRSCFANKKYYFRAVVTIDRKYSTPVLGQVDSAAYRQIPY